MVDVLFNHLWGSKLTYRTKPVGINKLPALVFNIANNTLLVTEIFKPCVLNNRRVFTSMSNNCPTARARNVALHTEGEQTL